MTRIVLSSTSVFSAGGESGYDGAERADMDAVVRQDIKMSDRTRCLKRQGRAHLGGRANKSVPPHKTPTTSANAPPTQRGNSAANKLRYCTDLDKSVLHFTFQRLGRQVEAVGSAQGGSRSAIEDERDLVTTALGDWHVFWMSVARVRAIFGVNDFRLQDQQIINHFPNHYELTRKDLMYKNIRRYVREKSGGDCAQPGTLVLYTAMNWVAAAVFAGHTHSEAKGKPHDLALLKGSSSHKGADPSRAGGDGGGSSAKLRFGAVSVCRSSVAEYSFGDSVPVTYNVPNDLSMFIEEFKRHPGALWIVKPATRSQGKGIFLINRIQQLLRWMKEKEAEASGSSYSSAPTSSVTGGGVASAGLASAHGLGGAFIVSRYITNPLLIGGTKFDLRLYVLVTSFKPLVAYLHEAGFARFCATKYVSDSLADRDLGSHLTNVALQKGDVNYNRVHGGKWCLQNLFLYLQARYGAYVADGLRARIEFLIFHSLKAVESVMYNDKHCFELYGYDILVDTDIKPHLIEVNASPSLSTTTLADRLLKEDVLTDTLKVVLPPGYPSPGAMPYAEYRHRTDLTTQLHTGFRLLRF